MAVKIRLTEKWWLTADSHSWALAVTKRYRDKATGGWLERLESQRFYPTVGEALRGCLDLELKASDAKTLEALAKHAERTSGELCEAVAGIDGGYLHGANEESMTYRLRSGGNTGPIGLG